MELEKQQRKEKINRNYLNSLYSNQLYKYTQLQETFSIIMLAIVGGVPKILNLKEMLRHYLDLQEDVITRRTRFDLKKAEARAHILEGLRIALDHIDEIIRIIRSSYDDAKPKLMERAWSICDMEAVSNFPIFSFSLFLSIVRTCSKSTTESFDKPHSCE